MNAREHQLRAQACIQQAIRFYDAAGHAGTSVNLDARIMHVAQALSFAHMAVAEASYAKPRATEGPTELQTRASGLADQCTRLMQQLAYDVARGALRPTAHTVLPIGGAP